MRKAFSARCWVNVSQMVGIGTAEKMRALMPLPLEPLMEGDRVHHRREHAHLVAGNAVAAGLCDRHATKDVAATGDDADLDAEGNGFADLGGDPVDQFLVDAEGLIAKQRLAGDFEQDLGVAERRRHLSRLVNRLRRAIDYTMAAPVSPTPAGAGAATPRRGYRREPPGVQGTTPQVEFRVVAPPTGPEHSRLSLAALVALPKKANKS